MRIDKFILTVIVFTIIVLFGGVFLATKTDKTDAVELTSEAKVKIENDKYDWGEIGINDGDVKTKFKITNEGTETLKLWNVVTSCACTTAQLFLDEVKSPLFGMHTKSDFVMEVPSGDTADLEVIFSPDFHGPTGVGPITRQINLQTNDIENPEISFTATADVTK